MNIQSEMILQIRPQGTLSSGLGRSSFLIEQGNMTNCISNISSDLLFKILLKLPAKCLIPYRSVSKLWRDIIDDPFFALEISGRRTDVVYEHVCNGTLSLYRLHRRFAYATLVIINLLTREQFVLPILPWLLSPVNDEVYSLGFDFKSKTYKVVSIRTNKSTKTGIAMLITLRSGNLFWRRISRDNFPNFCKKPSIATHDYLHWSTFFKDRDDKNRDSLLSFDIEKEEFISTLCPKSPYAGVNLKTSTSVPMCAYTSSW
ncbi:hypothetical protein ACFE04_018275 [Oxalis oulophora]